MKKNDNSGQKNNRKVRKLYHLEQDDVQFVRELADSKGVSESEIIRQAVRSFQNKGKEDPPAGSNW